LFSTEKEYIMTQATQKLVTDFKVLATDAEELVKATAAQTGEKIGEVRGKIMQSISGLKPRLAQAEAKLADNVRTAADSGNAYVRAKPWNAIGFAVIGGLIIGLLIGRR
jgi:ElaB/YqjD/DUF883 family membrane-anchored ribosome-binding protein